jgi:hypothetical protein
MESSTNDSALHSNYAQLCLGFSLSYLLHNISITIYDSFQFQFLVFGGLLLISAILVLLFLYESPRYNFEFYQYDNMTKTFMNIAIANELDKLYIKKDDLRFRQEIRKNTLANHASCCEIWDKIIFLGINQRVIKMKKEIEKYEFCELKKIDFRQNPFLPIVLIRSNKNLRNHTLILISLVANISFIFFITLNNFTLTFIYSREDMFGNYVVNRFPFFITCVVVCSSYFFHFLLKFFGYNVILFVCFGFNFIFSLIYSICTTAILEPEDMNKDYFNSPNILAGTSQSFFIALLCVIAFFTYGLYLTMFIYLTKFTKTIYRCSFYGLVRIVVDTMMIFAFSLTQYFPNNMFYATIASIIGFVNAYFIDGEMGYNIISDFRKIEFDGQS